MLQYQRQDSTQTLAQGIEEYFSANPDLSDVRRMSPEAERFFRCHDAAHVVFGCSTALDDEAVVKIASLFGTTAGFGVLAGYRLHESLAIYRRLRLAEVLRSIARSVVVVPRTILRCRRQHARWPWDGYQRYLPVPLQDIRQAFNIEVEHSHA